MAPVLLDQRRLLLLFSGTLLALVLAYAAGYYTGVSKVDNGLTLEPERVSLALPEPAAVIADSIDPVLPEVIAPGAEIDVDVPDTPAQPLPVAKQPRPAAAKPEAKNIQKPSKAAAVTVAAPEPEAKASTESSAGQQPAVESSLAIGGPAPDLQEDEALASQTIIDDATAEDALYSIQVGIYGSHNNAQRQVEELSAQNLSAWLDEYQNQDDKTRYNVRFGYFASRASAVAALEAWERQIQPKSSSGYVVRLSR